jgi:hypothetical protein
MSFEGTFVYSGPIPYDTNDKSPSLTGTTLVIDLGDESVQSLLNTIAEQRQEIERLRKAIVLVRSFMTKEQLEALKNHVMSLIEEEQK